MKTECWNCGKSARTILWHLHTGNFGIGKIPAGAEGELNEETQTKADENEQFLLQQEYSKTAFIIPSCSGWFNIDSIHEIEM